jgi:hypothetical protein
VSDGSIPVATAPPVFLLTGFAHSDAGVDRFSFLKGP